MHHINKSLAVFIICFISIILSSNKEYLKNNVLINNPVTLIPSINSDLIYFHLYGEGSEEEKDSEESDEDTANLEDSLDTN